MIGLAQDKVAIRLRLAHLLNTADLESRALPAAAVLVVRRLDEPVPLALNAPVISRAWERSVRGALEDHSRTAAHPAAGPVPANASAVVFADRAEMLACLAVDLHRGEAQTRWWWRAVLRAYLRYDAPITAADAFTAMSLDAPRYSAAAVRTLASRPEGRAVLQACSRGQATELAIAIATEFHLPAVADVLREYSRHTTQFIVRHQNHHEQSSEAALSAPLTDLRSTYQAATVPWHRLSSLQELATLFGSRPQQIMTVLAHAVEHARWLVTSPQFTEDLEAWLAQETQTAQTTSQSRPHQPESKPRVARDATTSSSRSTMEPGSAWTPSADEFRVDPEHAASSTGRPQVASGTTRQSRTSGQINRGAVITNDITQGSHHSAKSEADLLTPQPFPKSATAVQTRVAGCLYLVNLLDSSHLLEGWPRFEIMARALAGPRRASDPLWEFLAELGGRHPHELSEPGFTLPPLTEFPCTPEPPLLARFRDNRAEFWDPRGFPVLASTVHGIVEGYRPIPRPFRRAIRPLVDIQAIVHLANTDLRRFIALASAHLRWRLQRITRLPLDNALAAVFDHQGTVHATATHIDVVMDLEEISVPVRIAGLDKDPGWIPELGRIIQFHFTGGSA